MTDPQHPETPIIIIERENAPEPKHRSPWKAVAITVAVVVALATLAFFSYRYWKQATNLGVPVSYTASQNIARLSRPLPDETPEVVATTDTILGVPLEIYAIHGLVASLEFQEPTLDDESVYLYSRSADHKADGTYIGALTVEGEDLPSSQRRIGYMAMTGSNQVIGVGASDKVQDHVRDLGGSFFRQFILVSDGELPPKFYLHGKVERRALGRIGDRLYYIATPAKETMWDFADALREYGFADAIYITGGKDYTYYRSADGLRHDIGNPADYPHKKWQGVIPWLVFRKPSAL